MTTINNIATAVATRRIAWLEESRKSFFLGEGAKATTLARETLAKAEVEVEEAEKAFCATKEGKETLEAMRRFEWDHDDAQSVVHFATWLKNEGGFKAAVLRAGRSEAEASIPLSVRALDVGEKLDRVKARFEYANTGAHGGRPGAIWFHLDPVRTLHWQETEEEYQARRAWYKSELEALGLRADSFSPSDTGWEISLHGGHTLTLF